MLWLRIKKSDKKGQTLLIKLYGDGLRLEIEGTSEIYYLATAWLTNSRDTLLAVIDLFMRTRYIDFSNVNATNFYDICVNLINNPNKYFYLITGKEAKIKKIILEDARIEKNKKPCPTPTNPQIEIEMQ